MTPEASSSTLCRRRFVVTIIVVIVIVSIVVVADAFACSRSRPICLENPGSMAESRARRGKFRSKWWMGLLTCDKKSVLCISWVIAPQSMRRNGIYADYEKMAVEGASHRCVRRLIHRLLVSASLWHSSKTRNSVNCKNAIRNIW